MLQIVLFFIFQKLSKVLFAQEEPLPFWHWKWSESISVERTRAGLEVVFKGRIA